MVETRIFRSLLPDYNIFKSIPVHRIAVLLLALTISGAHVKGDEALRDTEVDQKEASSGQNVEVDTRNDSWIENLMWSLLAYATIMVPSALIIRMLKNSNFNERSGTSCLLCSIQLCVFSAPHIESADVEEGGIEGSSSKDESLPPPSFSQTSINLLFCAGGLQLTYLTWGVVQEQIVTQTYEEHLPDGSVTTLKFTNSQFLVFVNHSLALVVASACILFTHQPRHTAPLYKYCYSSFSNTLSSWCQYEALKYVSFPTQVLCKTSKIIPVMIMGKIVSNKSYPYHEYVVAVLLCVGVSLFLLAADPSGKRTSAATTFSGAILLLGHVAFDSFTSNWQSELFSVYKMSTIQMMFGANLFSCLFTVWSMIAGGNFLAAVGFMMTHPKFPYHATILSLASVTGQLFIFYTIQSFGPIVFTIIMTIRMMLSFMLSCIIYNHPLSAQGVFGVIVVFVALLLRVYARYSAKLSSEGCTPLKTINV